MALFDASGTSAGTSTATGAAQMIFGVTGSSSGVSSLGNNANVMLLSMIGTAPGAGMMFGSPDVVRVPASVECSCHCPDPKIFWYLESFDQWLSIYFKTCQGPVDPVWAGYSLFYIRPDGSLKLVGPLNQPPNHGPMVGHYYAIGRAGDCGQPGRWMIRWEAQLTCSSTRICKEMCFIVQDAVLAHHPADILCRTKKYGWL